MQRQSPLDGIRILDLTRILAGPWSTQNLADLGADVVKIEHPERGDDTRGWGPPFLHDEAGNATSEAAYFLSVNRNKRSVTLDFTTEEGQAIIRRMAAKSDILVENYKVGGLAKYSLDYASLREINPRLIYCSITGFGQDGPFASLPGYDFMIQGMGGLMSITGERDGLPGGGPQKAGVAVVDVMTGMYATVSMLAAIIERERSGLGQHIDVALLDCQVAMLANQNLNYLTSGTSPTRAGNAHQNVVPYQVFEASDGHLIVAVGNDSQFRAYCDVLGNSALGMDPRFQSNSQRIIHRAELIPELERIMRTRTRDAWLEALEAEGVPCGPINTIAQALDTPQAKHRSLARWLPHPTAGKAPTTASPIRLSETPVQYRKAPPLLGEDTREVLQEWLGIDAAEIDQLGAKGVIRA